MNAFAARASAAMLWIHRTNNSTHDWMVNHMRTWLVIGSLFSLIATGCTDGGAPNDLPDAQPQADAPPQADANLACPEPTSVLPNEWRPINIVSAGAVAELQPGLIYADGTAGGLPNAAENPYIYIRFGATPEKVEIADTASYNDASWDIAIKRYVFRVNSGDSGPGGVEVAAVSAVTLDEVTAPPADSAFLVDDWVSDECVYSGGLLGEPVTAIGTWYGYDEMNRLTPLDYVFVIKRPDGTTYKFKVQSYYHDGNLGANYAIEWATL